MKFLAIESPGQQKAGRQRPRGRWDPVLVLMFFIVTVSLGSGLARGLGEPDRWVALSQKSDLHGKIVAVYRDCMKMGDRPGHAACIVQAHEYAEVLTYKNANVVLRDIDAMARE